ncbi:LOW QUALITY PROTEIN: hypothetical protein CFOL_v3_01608, partial [Cephalotus follicularis]
YLFCYIIFSHQIVLSVGDGGQDIAQNTEGKPSFAEIVTDTIKLLKKSHKSSWDKVKTIIHEMQQFFPPNIDFRSAEEAHAGVGAGGKMKAAVEKSFGKSEEALEASAKTAAKAVADAMHKTAEKKDSVSVSHNIEPHDEL